MVNILGFNHHIITGDVLGLRVGPIRDALGSLKMLAGIGDVSKKQ